MIHVVDFEKTAFSTPFRGVLPPFGQQISAESGRATQSLAPGKPGWPPTSTWPLFSRPTPHDARTSGIRPGTDLPPLATAIHRQPNWQRPNGARSRDRPFSIQYVTDPGDRFGQIKLLLPTRRRLTVDHFLVAGGAQAGSSRRACRMASRWNARAP